MRKWSQFWLEGALQEVRLSFMASPSCSDTCILRRPPHSSHAGFWAPKVSKPQDDFWWGEQVGCAAPFYPDTVTPTDAAWRHVVLMMGLGHSHHPRMWPVGPGRQPSERPWGFPLGLRRPTWHLSQTRRPRDWEQGCKCVKVGVCA